MPLSFYVGRRIQAPSPVLVLFWTHLEVQEPMEMRTVQGFVNLLRYYNLKSFNSILECSQIFENTTNRSFISILSFSMMKK